MAGSIPPWLDRSINKLDLFRDYIKDHKLGKAWLSLNSGEMDITDVAACLRELQFVACNKQFDVVVENWISRAIKFNLMS